MGGWAGTLGMESSPVNSEMARSRIVDLATRYVATGVDSKRAISLAKDVFEESTLLYNGVIVDVGTSSARAAVPNDFKASVDAQVENFLDLSKRKDIDKDEISLIQMGDDGRFVLVDRDDLLPVTDDEGRMYRFNMADLRDWETKTTEERTRSNLREHTFKANVAAKGYIHAVDTDGSTNWIDPKTREVFDLDYSEEASTPTWKKTGKRYSRSIIVEQDGSTLFKFPARKVRPRGSFDEEMRAGVEKYRANEKKWRDFRDSLLPSVKVGGYTLVE